MNLIKFFLGILLVVGSIIYLIRIIKEARKDKKYDSYILYSDINIIAGTATFLIVGLYLLFREISKVI